jgi:hypothetical protein
MAEEIVQHDGCNGDGGQAVNSNTRGTGVNRWGLSLQQRAILAVIAELKPQGVDENESYGCYRLTPYGTAGYYHPGDITPKLAQAGDRSASASLARAFARLERRGLIHRHGYRDPKKHSGYRFFTLTPAGLQIVNAIRHRRGLPQLVVKYFPTKKPMTEEEFTQRLEAMRAARAMHAAIQAATQLSPAGLAQLREWIDQRLATTTG